MSKGIKIILVVSVIINILFIGIIIGHFSKRAEHWGKMRSQMNETIGTLPEDKKDMIESAMRNLRRETRGTHKQLEKKRIELLQILTAKQFDKDKFENEVKQLHNLHGDMAFEMADTVSKLAENLNQQERIALSEFIEEMRKHRRRGGPPGSGHRLRPGGERPDDFRPHRPPPKEDGY